MQGATDVQLRDEFRELVRQCLAGQQAAFLELVHQFRGRVYGLCFRMLGHREDAEDATQETFLRVARNLHRWDPERDFEPWLLTIAGNRCRTRLSTRSRRPNVQTLDWPIVDASHHGTAAENLAEEVHLALDVVREEYRQAFLYFHQHEMSYAEIAAKMDVPLGTIKTWVHRARRHLCSRLIQREVISEPRRELSAI